jgi:hypothetical protein
MINSLAAMPHELIRPDFPAEKIPLIPSKPVLLLKPQ